MYQCSRKSEPESTLVSISCTSLPQVSRMHGWGPYKGAEDDKRKSISQEKLQYTTDDHEETSHEVVCTDRRNSVPAGAPPSHEVAAERGKRKQKAEQGLGEISNWGVHSESLVAACVIPEGLGWQKSCGGRPSRYFAARDRSSQTARG